MKSARQVRQQEIAATVSRDPVALRDLWTDDAIRLGAGQAEVGRQTIRASNESTFVLSRRRSRVSSPVGSATYLKFSPTRILAHLVLLPS